jgi:hypothetical protein
MSSDKNEKINGIVKMLLIAIERKNMDKYLNIWLFLILAQPLNE